MNINSIPYNPKYTEEQVALGVDFLVDNKSKFSGTTNYAIIHGKNVVTKYMGQPCHRGIGSSYRPPSNRHLVATEIGITRAKRGNDADEFLSWLIFESPFARFIITKDLMFAKEYGILVSSDIPAPLLQNIMIVSRHFWEVAPQAFEKFNSLTASGVDAKVAYPICFNTTWSNAWTKENGVVFPYGGHRAFPVFNLRAFHNWMEGEIGTATTLSFISEKENYRDNADYVGGTKFFSNARDDLYKQETSGQHFIYDLLKTNPEFRDVIGTFRRGDASVAYRPPNPFAPKVPGETKPAAGQITFKELWECALPWCIENNVFNRGASNG